MARHYSTKSCFRQMPNALLARYLHEHELFTNLDIAGMGETRTDELFTAWLALPDEVRTPIDAGLQGIFAMSYESGFAATLFLISAFWEQECPY